MLQSMANYAPSFAYNLPSLTPGKLVPVNPITVGALTPLAPLTSINGVNPNKNPYQPLTAAALPQLAEAAVDTGTAQVFLTQFDTLIPGLFTTVQTAVTNLLSSGGQDIAPAISNAIFNTGYGRNLQTLNDAFDLAGARAGAKGNRYCNSMVKTAQMQALTTYQYGLDDMSRKIVEIMASFAQANLKEAINAGVRVDEVRAQIFTTTSSVLTRMQELALDEYKTCVLTNYQVFEAALRLQMTDLELQKADREEMRAWIGQLRDQIKLASQVTVTEFEVGNKLQVLQAEVDKYIADLVIKGNEQQLMLFGELVKQLVAQQQMTLQEIEDNNKLQVTMLQSVAAGYGELIKSMSSQGVTIQTTNTTS
jgi:uncharacterized protein YqfB (UPF0267 family)